MKLIPREWQRDIFETEEEVRVGEDCGIEDPTEFVEIPVERHDVRWLDREAEVQWAKWEPKLHSAILPNTIETPTHAPTVTGTWCRWDKNHWVPIDKEELPESMVLDVEAAKEGGWWHPICAVAMGTGKTFAWVRTATPLLRLVDLIPFPKNRLVVNWNVSYDRQYLQSELEIEDSGNRFLDGMSFAQAIHGVSDKQMPQYKSMKNNPGRKPNWVLACSGMSLKEVAHRYLGINMDKSVRDELVGMAWSEWPQHIERIVMYCATDVIITVRLTALLYNKLRAAHGGYVSKAASWTGQIEMSSPLICLDSRWWDYTDRCSFAYYDLLREQDRLLRGLIYQKLQQGSDERLDWTPLKTGANKGKPKWYVKWINTKTLTMGMDIAPVLLGLCWKGEPIVKVKEGTKSHWSANGEALPHPQSTKKKLSNPLIADYKYYVEEGSLMSDIVGVDLMGIYEGVGSATNWKSIATRMEDVRAVATPKGLVVVPVTRVMGTQSRRAADSTWLVAVKPDEDKIGSEFRGMVKAPEGYKIVGADFDSEESWLASLLGDREVGALGGCELSQSILVGSKERGTDPHTLSAKRDNIPRNIAKNMNFAAQYLCGAPKLADMLRVKIPSLSAQETKEKADKYLRNLKGELTRSGVYKGGVGSPIFTAMAELANTPNARSPILGFKIPATLDADATKDEFITTRANWGIQTSGVDVLHLTLTGIRACIERDNIRARLMFTVHDELKYLVKEEDAVKFAYILQEVHLAVKAYAYDAVGFQSMPASQAWFSSIEIDDRFRKEYSDECRTPTNPAGFPVTGFALTPPDFLNPKYLQLYNAELCKTYQDSPD
jgi:DNA polymerase gamma 1